LPGVTLSRLFVVFLKTGTFALGGVYSMLALFHKELVTKHGWLTEDGFSEGVAIGQALPGPAVINSGIYFAYRLMGLRGAVAAITAMVVPGFISVLALGYIYVRHEDWPYLKPFLKGVAASVIGLLLSVVFRMGRASLVNAGSWAIASGAFCLLLFMKANPVLLIALAGFSGWLIYRRS
jgi:chromate transporter